jgi:A/G-specific adenine glycosylase
MALQKIFTEVAKKGRQPRTADGLDFVTDLNLPQLAQDLSEWYLQNKRELPWRKNRDPYRIWVSEVMLQQTTVQAVIPYYEKFMQRFPNVGVLAGEQEQKVLQSWAGLGYYSRARNLHKAAKLISQNGFPKRADELLQLPGFGPYTSRAVASLAFGEKVGVLDGNVIRVLSRVSGWAIAHWKNQEKEKLQRLSDGLAIEGASEVINQGMMELGATICTPHNPACLLCPWSQACRARKENRIEELPLKKPRRKNEFWLWEPIVQTRKNGKQIALIENDYAPFLKGHLILPGVAKPQTQKPRNFSGTHGITHHSIFIRLLSDPKQAKKLMTKTKIHWVNLANLQQKSPSTLIKKAIEISERDEVGKRKK